MCMFFTDGITGNILDAVNNRQGVCAAIVEFDPDKCDNMFCPSCGVHAHMCDGSCGFCHPPADWSAKERAFEVCFRSLHGAIQEIEEKCILRDLLNRTELLIDCQSVECAPAVAQLGHVLTHGCKDVKLSQYTHEIGSGLSVALKTQQRCGAQTWNPCDSDPCGPGVCHLATAETYSCTCPHSYVGKNCEITQDFTSKITNCREFLIDSSSLIDEACCVLGDNDNNK